MGLSVRFFLLTVLKWFEWSQTVMEYGLLESSFPQIIFIRSVLMGILL